MILKNFIHLKLINFALIQLVKSDSYDTDDLYLHLHHNLQNVQTYMNIINTRLDLLNDRLTLLIDLKNLQYKSKELTHKTTKTIFDIRYDPLPLQCLKYIAPSTCAQAMECNQYRSGIYNLTDTHYSKLTFPVYCDNENYDGDWLYILKRHDGSIRFNRTWHDYVNGFGNVAGEHWLGLEKLYALTNFYGPQELNVFVENFEGEKRFARYDNFAIENSTTNYSLKSLGRYWGTAGDSLFNHLGAQFSTIEVDNDNSNAKCALWGNGGFWFSNCGYASPTSSYLHASNPDVQDNMHWYTFGGYYYSHKTIIFMIRRRKPEKLE